MFENFSKYPFILLLATIVAYGLTPLVRRLATAVGLVDQPGDRRLHAIPVPRLGGIALFVAFHLACATIFHFPWPNDFRLNLDQQWWNSFLLGSSLLLVVGIIDDIKGLSWFTKIVGQSAVAVLMFSEGIQMNRLQGVELPLALDLVFTVLWFLVFINAFNLIDGLDGLAAGLALVAAAGMAGAAVIRHSPSETLVLLALIGACLGFLRYNFHPASIFLGDCGSMFLGLTLAAISLSTSSKGSVVTTIGVPLLAAGVPIFDTVLAIWRRSMRAFFRSEQGKGLANVMGADMEHLHHRLVKAGLKQHRVALSLYFADAALITVGILTLVFQDKATGIFLLAFLAGAYVVVRHVARVELWDSGSALVRGLKRPRRGVIAAMLYPVMDALTLAAALVITLVLTDHADHGPLKQQFLTQLPVWIGLPFLCLVVGGTYNQVWSMARVTEFTFLVIALSFGIALATAVNLIATSSDLQAQMSFSLLYFGIAGGIITGLRALPRSAQELMSVLTHWSSKGSDDAEHVVIYGVSIDTLCYLKHSAEEHSARGAVRVVIGLLSTDRNLHSRYVYGAKVLGDLSALIELAKTTRIDKVVLTRSISLREQELLTTLALAYDITVTEWQISEHTAAKPHTPALAQEGAKVAG